MHAIFKKTIQAAVDLGWSEYNALEDEEFSDEPKGKTWQDWHRTVKQMHPVKYWIAETFGDWLRYSVWLPIKRPFEKAHYWLVSHIVPSRRYHMLDLRQPGGYQYGWQDVPEKMLYAMFNLLGEYLNKESPHDLTQWYTREQIEADAGLKKQQDDIEEARAIYHWWTVERKKEFEAKAELTSEWCAAKKAKAPNKEELWAAVRKMDEDLDKKEDEMIARLMKIRRTLWT